MMKVRDHSIYEFDVKFTVNQRVGPALSTDNHREVKEYRKTYRIIAPGSPNSEGKVRESLLRLAQQFVLEEHDTYDDFEFIGEARLLELNGMLTKGTY